MANYPWKLISQWIPKQNSKIWMDILSDNLSWQQPKVRLYGKEYLVPRKTVFLGELGIEYKYSGVIHEASGWPDWFYPLLNKIRDSSKIDFNGCLINFYRDGNDRMGWHADNERELYSNISIYSLSFGSSRDFILRHRNLPLKEVVSLSDGDLLIMYPDCQKYWLHSIPIRRKVLEPRINLTFRCYRYK